MWKRAFYSYLEPAKQPDMESVLLAIKDKIATVTLNRPEKYNAVNRDLALTLQKKLKEAGESNAVRCITLTGVGKAFCSGQDLTEIKDPTGPEMKRILPEQLNPIVKILRTIEKPVLCVVNGVAAGAAVNIALCCDIVIASESAYFVQAFSKIGLIPDTGGTFMLPRLVGLQRATALMMLAEKIGGREAAEMGMIYKCFPDDALQQEALKMANSLASMPTKALIYTRKALNQSMTAGFGTQLDNEAEWQEKAAATDDFREGINAFLEKRKPDFKGK